MGNGGQFGAVFGPEVGNSKNTLFRRCLAGPADHAPAAHQFAESQSRRDGDGANRHGGRLFPRLIAPGRPGMRRAAHDAGGELRPAWQDRTRPAPGPPWRCALAARHAAPESANARPARGKVPPAPSKPHGGPDSAGGGDTCIMPAPENAPAPPASHARHGKPSHRWAYLAACAPCRPLTLAGLRRILRPSPRKRRHGFSSPEYQGGRPPPSGFFTSAARQAPYGRAVREGFGPAGALVPVC